MKRTKLFSVLSAAFLLGGCVDTRGPIDPAAPGGSAATWQMPWQLNPISSQSAAYNEQVVSSFVPGTGFVRGTPAALASVGKPLPRVATRNRTVNACRSTVEGEARKLGARQVEAVAAGPDRRDAQGRYAGSVLMRITYVRATGYEVRTARLTCIVDRKGKIVDAFVGPATRTAFREPDGAAQG